MFCVLLIIKMLLYSIFYFFLCPQKHFEFAAFSRRRTSRKKTFKHVKQELKQARWDQRIKGLSEVRSLEEDLNRNVFSLDYVVNKNWTAAPRLVLTVWIEPVSQNQTQAQETNEGSTSFVSVGNHWPASSSRGTAHVYSNL